MKLSLPSSTHDMVIFSLLIFFSFLSSCGFGNKISDDDLKSRWKDRLNNFTDGRIYRGDKVGNQYFELSQINTENAYLLGPAGITTMATRNGRK